MAISTVTGPAEHGRPAVGARSTAATPRPPRVPTIGVEEEFLLVDPHTRAPVERAPEVIAAAATVLGDRVQAEFFPVQVEVCTRPAGRLAELRADLAELRRVVGAAAADAGCRLVASGTPVVSDRRPGRVTDTPRYHRMAARYATVLDGYDGALCGCHVHLGTVDRGQALELGGRLRPWLPVVQALAVNSPFSGGRDSGFASWRSVQWARWPTVGPAPVLDEPGYEALADALVASGVLMDRRMIYWYARPSEHVPTLEVRIADVNADLDTVVLLAGLLRGLAASLLDDAPAGGPLPELSCGLLGAAHWSAARHGLAGAGVDPATGRPAPVAALVDRLVDLATPGLRAAGDLAEVRTGLARLRLLGSGAARQRRTYRRRMRPADVVDELAELTLAVDG
ncbi:carboxylate-amine ligase [Kitasatospora sp. NPDC004240]